MLPAKDTDQGLNINESATDNLFQDTSDDASRFKGLERFHTEYLSRKTYVYIILYHFGLFCSSSLRSKHLSIDTKDL